LAIVGCSCGESVDFAIFSNGGRVRRKILKGFILLFCCEVFRFRLKKKIRKYKKPFLIV
jgi:hypothetical protein